MSPSHTVTLASLEVDRIRSVDPRKVPGKAFALYSIPAHDMGGFETVLGRDVGSPKKETAPNRVLLSGLNPRINRVRIVEDAADKSLIASSEWYQFDPGPNLLPAFLAYQLQQEHWRQHFATNVSGVGGSLTRLRGTALADLSVVVPPRDVQEKTIAKLDAQFSSIDATIASLTRAKANIQRARASILKAAVEGSLVPTEAELAKADGREYEPASVLLERILKERREKWEASGKKGKYKELVAPDADDIQNLPEGWEWTTLGAIGVWTSGGTPSRSHTEYYSGGIPWVKTGELVDAELKATEETLSEAGLANSSAKMFPVGTLLVAMYGATIGMTGHLAVEAATNQACAALLPSTANEPCLPYLWIYLISNRAAFRRIGQGGAQPNISQAILTNWPLALPPLAEQTRICADVAHRLSVLHSLEATLTDQVGRCRQLRQSALKCAFEGKLA